MATERTFATAMSLTHSFEEEALKVGKNKYRGFFENMVGGFAYHKVLLNKNKEPVDYVFLEVNKEYEKLTGLQRRKIIGKKVTEAVPEIKKDPVDWIRFYGRVAMTGEPARFESYSEVLEKWYDVSAYSPSKGFFVTVLSDITERKRSEDKVKQLQEYLQLQINRMPIGLIVLDREFRVRTWNPAAEKIFGFTEQEAKGKHPYDFIVPKTAQPLVNKIWNRLLQGDETAHSINENLTKNGQTITCSWSNTPLKNKDGLVFGALSMVQDITEREKAEEELRESEEKYRSLFSHMINGYAYCEMIFDAEGKPVDFVYLEVNDAFERLTGLKKCNVVGKRATQATPGIKEANPELFEKYAKIAQTGESEDFETFFKPLNIWVSISLHSPKKGYFAAIFRNITEQKQLEETIESYSEGLEYTVAQRTKELSEAQERLLKTERLATIGEMAGMVGHDLRNPLAGIKNAVYLLRKKQGSFIGDSGNEMLTTIDKAVDHANNIVADLLDFSREIHLELEEYSPKSLVNYVLLSIKIPNNIKITQNTHTQPTIWVDANKLERVFVNLIKNAFEAMPNGGTLEISSHQNGENIEFTFADTGNGMSEDVAARIFTPLFTTKAQGMGFGLAICKRMIEAHGGKIAVETAPNKGTKFTISLPIEQARAKVNFGTTDEKTETPT